MNTEELKSLITDLAKIKRRAVKLGFDGGQLSGILGETQAAYIVREMLGDTSYFPAPPNAQSIDANSEVYGGVSVKWWTIKDKSSSKLFLHPSLDFSYLLIIMNRTNYLVPRDAFTTIHQTGLKLKERIDLGVLYLTNGGKKGKALAASDTNVAILNKHYVLKNDLFLNEVFYTKDIGKLNQSQLEILSSI